MPEVVEPAQAPMKLLVREDGSALGSVGGGCLEEEVKRLAAEVIEITADCSTILEKVRAVYEFVVTELNVLVDPCICNFIMG